MIVGSWLTLDLQYGKLLKDLSSGANDTIVATFADGSTAEGNLVVGCDGANSVVRHCILDESAAQVEDLDIQMLNVSCTFSKETAMLQRMGHPVFKNSYHPDGFMWWQSIQDVEDPTAPETWLFQNVISWVGEPRAKELPDAASRMKYWKEKAQTFAEPWRTVGRDLPDDFPVHLDRTTVWRPTVDWSGKFGHSVTIAGDAAHAMPPHRGQGLNNALQDAAVLVDELKAVKAGNKTLSDAINAFEKDMKERTLQEIPISIAQVGTLTEL
jgi:2-polyprenyl-6-methoxyphenol hydroxylase-like FAD-dependent oxidoreductase